MFETLAVLLLVAALIEAVWEALKPALDPVVKWLDGKGVPTDRLAALIISLAVSFGVGGVADLFELLGLPVAVPYLGTILTAVILARGSNFVHDLIGALNRGGTNDDH